MTVELSDVQGDTLCGYGFRFAHYAFLAITDRAAARATLAAHLDDITVAKGWGGDEPPYGLNVAFTAEGLRALGLSAATLDTFESAFTAGMRSRAAMLGDVAESDPDNWEPLLRDSTLHVLVTLAANDEQALLKRRATFESVIADAGSGLAPSYSQDAAKLAEEREHFGFRDGYSQPQIDDPVAGPKWRPGQGTPLPDGGWEGLQPGEFVFGYRNEDGMLARGPAAPYGENGTYMVWRKLRQNVAGFWGAMHTWSDGSDAEATRLAAKVVGRWPDGTPVVVSPDRPDPAIANSDDRVSDFRYGDDPLGIRCPLGAHVRRSNPRDALGFEGRLTKRHRIIRRGMPYGPPPKDRLRDDKVDRGLIFVCYQASIERQFEVVQAGWLMDGNPFGLGEDTDFLTGNGDPRGKMTIPGTTPAFLGPQQAWVRTRGGEYLFKPGIRALRALVGFG